MEAGIQLTTIKLSSSFIFIPMTALLSQDILPFSVRNCVFAPERELVQKLCPGVTQGTPRLIEK